MHISKEMTLTRRLKYVCDIVELEEVVFSAISYFLGIKCISWLVGKAKHPTESMHHRMYDSEIKLSEKFSLFS